MKGILGGIWLAREKILFLEFLVDLFPGSSGLAVFEAVVDEIEELLLSLVDFFQ